MRRIKALSCAVAVLAATASTLLLTAGPASAHEFRQVGKYGMAVGFGDEPAFAFGKNSVQLFLSDTNGNPIVDLGPTLKVDVSYGDKTLPTMTMEPNFEIGEFGTPGEYDAFFFPTRPGTYSFHLTGSIKGQKINQTFTSGPKTFGPMENPQSVEFPAKDPTNGQLADRLKRELPRLDSQLADQSSSLQDKVDSAKTLGLIGLIVGILGLLTGGVALARSRKR